MTAAAMPLALMAQEREAASTPEVAERGDTLLTVAPSLAARPFAISPSTTFFAPYGSAMLGAWDLHEGLNAQIGAGVRVGWGKHSPWRGASFFTDVAGLYAFPVSQDGRWTAAVGGYYSNFKLWGSQVNSLGVMGMVDYRVNDRLNVGGFVMHDFGVMGGDRGWGPTLPYERPSTTVGADVGVRLTEKTSLNVGLSFTTSQEPFGPLVPPRPRIEHKPLEVNPQ